jgi:two-component system sensor histidine kinase MprB
LRVKLVVAMALLAALASAAIGWLAYRATADRLLVEVDRSLVAAVQDLAGPQGRAEHRGLLSGRGPSFDLVVYQLLDQEGDAVAASRMGLPVDDADRAVAAEATGADLRRDVTVDGEDYRMLTAGRRGGGAVQAARSLAETDRLLGSLRNRIVAAVGLVTIVAAGAGWLIARQITRRLVRLTATAEEVAETGRLDVPVPVEGRDEAGRLGAAFNEMLVALARSKDEQQRLVQDAGHELRTPLTSLRTNLAVLQRHAHLDPIMLAKVLADLEGEARELTDLTNELVELATDRRDAEPPVEVSLGELAERVAERAVRRTGRQVTVDADGSVVIGRPLMLERAISNLVDNAAKFDDGGAGPIEVIVRDGSVEVLDRGPGVASSDLPHLFDRFYRAPDARSRPGSGLGLAIVKGVADIHRGSVFAAPRPGGGAIVGFRVPTRAFQPSS